MSQGQSDWHFCSKCFGMFYAGDPRGFTGRCSEGGGHQKHGFNFVLPHDVPETPNTQQMWLFCWKCFGLHYAGGSGTGVCPAADGGHRRQYSFNFVLPHSIRQDPHTQKDWRFCQRCFVLFHAGSPPGHVGTCPAPGGGGHHPYGFNFVLPHTAQFYTPPVVTPTPAVPVPVIDVSYNRSSQTFTVEGRNFVPNHVVHVRVVNQASWVAVIFDTTSNSAGRIINFPISFAINVPQTYGFSANDERSDSDDRTGTLWSNTVTITAT